MIGAKTGTGPTPSETKPQAATPAGCTPRPAAGVDRAEEVGTVTKLLPLVLAARLAKEERTEEFIVAYLRHHWGVDIHGEEVE